MDDATEKFLRRQEEEARADADRRVAAGERHGHVLPHPQGLLCRCGGPALCEVCRAEERLVEREKKG